ncbi:MAG: oxidoreductase [Filimonas sp.]|nr:oxidoreductase [Filimonas sp.]
MKHPILLCFALLLSTVLFAQSYTINVLDSNAKVSLRGLSVVDDNTIWASGSRGTVVRSTDGGKTFTWMQVPGFEKRDFRDIEAFDANTAVIIAIAEPAQILRTTDGGKNWNVVFTDSTKGMFLDAMAFANKKEGFVIGDPINQQAYLATTKDGGQTWAPQRNVIALNDGEAFFASSGTNIQPLKKMGPIKDIEYIAITGGKKSRLFGGNWIRWDLPIVQGLESTGANSIAISPDNKNAVVVGGDFTKDTISANNCVLVNFSDDNHLSQPITNPHGYRSCVVYLSKRHLITCGTSGVDISTDAGKNWTLISKKSFHVVQKAKKGDAVFLAGNGGKIARLQ